MNLYTQITYAVAMVGFLVYLVSYVLQWGSWLERGQIIQTSLLLLILAKLSHMGKKA